jgi:lipopolysaccharide export LptBFGC system permease protein LptF
MMEWLTQASGLSNAQLVAIVMLSSCFICIGAMWLGWAMRGYHLRQYIKKRQEEEAARQERMRRAGEALASGKAKATFHE